MRDDDLDRRLGRLRVTAYDLVREGELLAVAARQSPGFGASFADVLEKKLQLARDILGLPVRPGDTAAA